MAARALLQRTVQAWKALPNGDRYFAKGAVCAVPVSVVAGSVVLTDSRDLPTSMMVSVVAGGCTVIAWPVVMSMAGLAVTLVAIDRKMH
jgi:hypothetical protein